MYLILSKHFLLLWVKLLIPVFFGSLNICLMLKICFKKHGVSSCPSMYMPG